jgi:hypothetical protein
VRLILDVPCATKKYKGILEAILEIISSDMLHFSYE